MDEYFLHRITPAEVEDAQALLRSIKEDTLPDVPACRALIRALGREDAEELCGNLDAMKTALSELSQ